MVGRRLSFLQNSRLIQLIYVCAYNICMAELFFDIHNDDDLIICFGIQKMVDEFWTSSSCLVNRVMRWDIFDGTVIF